MFKETYEEQATPEILKNFLGCITDSQLVRMLCSEENILKFLNKNKQKYGKKEGAIISSEDISHLQDLAFVTYD